MALTDKKYNSLHGKTGSDKNSMKAKFDEGHQHVYVDNPDGGDPAVVAMIYQIGQLEEELDYLRTEISSNKDKTGISSSQAGAIKANTAKTGITLEEQKDIANTKTQASTNTSEISKSNTNISTNTNAVATSIRVGAYPALPPLAPAGTTQSHGSEIVYDKLQNKYFLNIYYVEITPGKGGKNQRVVRTGQIELT